MADAAFAPPAGQRLEAALHWTTLVLVFVAATFIFSAPLRHPDVPEMTWFQDDLFYYLKTAANLAAGHGSTFDGVHRTNGYHPLYFLLLTLLTRLNPSLAFLTACLSALAVVASVASFLAMRALLRRCISAPPAFLDAVAILALIPCLNIFYLGMETTLTVPLGLLLLATWLRSLSRPSPAAAAAVGALSAAVTLSRLDAIFLVAALLFCTYCVKGEIHSLSRRVAAAFLAAFAICVIPYVVTNRLCFGAWLPVSGAAKQLRRHHIPSVEAWRSVLHPTVSQAALLLLSAIGVLLFLALREHLSPATRAVLAAALAFRWIQVAALSVVSDWPLWGWYFYSVRFAVLSTCILAALILSRSRFAPRSQAVCNALLALSLAALFANHWKRDSGSENIYETASRLAGFAAAHPGTIAMGDRAGMVGYLSRSSVLQTEGLVMDRPFLDHIRREDDLLTTLRAYGVRFYVASLEDPNFEGSCLLAAEPVLAGPDSPRMRSRLCRQPVLTIPGEHTTFVFDLTTEP